MAISNLTTGLRSGVCTFDTRPTAPYEGQMIYETDTNRVLVWDNAAWVDASTGKTQRSGLVLIEGKTFSTTTEVKFDNCFSTDFDNYKVMVTITSNATSDSGVRMQYGNGTTFASTTYGNFIFYWGNPDTPSGFFVNENFTGTGAFVTHVGGDIMPNTSTIDIFNPFKAEKTSFSLQAFGSYFSASTQRRVSLVGSGSHNQATSYASLRIYNSQNMSGRAYVYGYNQ